MTGQHVAVIGGGIVGTATAEALLRDGHRVTLVEPGPFGGEQAASFGNGAFISPASILPMSMPGLWRRVPGFLADPSGPLTVRARHLPRLAPWLLRFLAAGATQARVTRTAAALAALLGDAPGRHVALAARIGRAELVRHAGLLYLYPSRADWLAEGFGWELRRRHGLETREIAGDALAQAVPGLAPRYGFGVILPGGHHSTDPGAYVAAIAAACRAQGMIHMTARATGFVTEAGRLAAIRTSAGDLACDRAVIAAGIGAAALARQAGDRVPLEAERGYHVAFPGALPDLPMPLMPQDLKVAVVRTAGALRVAGQVEFATARAAPDWRRAEILRRAALSMFPALAGDPGGAAMTRWQGNRPSTPDGLPVIGAASRIEGVHHAFGHGHVGLNAAPMTAELTAAGIAGRAPPVDPAPFRPGRFA
ncbi:NAD(P)/FAD-dependent oxidoreductase [Mangrovicoccus algicola]|uniref:FAD-binding oxidoreductase n=1 Tax=Mangrovicoccus algicola TaxID=2771008 RepID=A0A8J6Z398_9RHOB|nr:FAD-binding oxidoreductase [Mangrovicoccus algicola]MBE3636654.1 FAD-binding oxidoreductase [Mangrovicoccus algicola]